MTWAKLDDRFHSHPKVEQAGLAAVGLYAKAISYSACHELDGEVPTAWVRKQGGPRWPRTLVELGLWEHHNGSYWIVDFLKFNPSRAQLEERRAKDSERKAAGR